MKALARTMVGIPSQLGYQIVDDICRKSTKLTGCCCAGAAHAIWSMQLPVNVRAHISNMTFDATTYRQVFEHADKVFLSSKQLPAVAAMSVPDGAASQLDETLPAFHTQNQPQVAAVTGNRGGRGGRGQRGGNRGGQRNNGRGGGQGNQGSQNQGKGQGKGQSQPQQRGPRHHSNPPESCCDRHYRHGDQAWFCLAPLTCPWVSRVTAK